MTIRLAYLSDAILLRDLSEVTFRDTYSPFNTPENMEAHVAEKFDLDTIESELQKTDYQHIVIENEEALIGFAKLVLNHAEGDLEVNGAIEIQRFYILPEYKGQNLGRKLMDFCCKWASQQGFKTIWLGVWEHNPNAFAFYTRMGFEQYGSHVFVLGDDIQNDYLMKKKLE
jgi:diamine N-acetyltransferase